MYVGGAPLIPTGHNGDELCHALVVCQECAPEERQRICGSGFARPPSCTLLRPSLRGLSPRGPAVATTAVALARQACGCKAVMSAL